MQLPPRHKDTKIHKECCRDAQIGRLYLVELCAFVPLCQKNAQPFNIFNYESTALI
jgi:hypothetical protein